MADLLVLVDGVVGHTDLEPPEPAALIFGGPALFVEEGRVFVFDRPIRGLEGAGAAEVAGAEMDRVAHGVHAGFFGRMRLVELGLTLGTHTPLASHTVGDEAVAGAVDEYLAVDRAFEFSVLLTRDDRRHGDRPFVLGGAVVVPERQVGVAGSFRRGRLVLTRQDHICHVGIQVHREVRRRHRHVVHHQVPHAVGPAVLKNLGVVT